MKKISALAIAGVFTASLAATAFAEMAEVKVGGEIRVRDVVTNNYDYDKDLGDRNNTITQRTRVNVDAKVNETTKAFIQLQDTRVWGKTSTTSTGAGETTTVTGNQGGAAGTAETHTSTTTGESVDVSQAYLQLDQLFGQPLSLRLGRQQLAYGDHRLIGNFEWSNFSRRFDALKLMYNTDAFSVDLFAAKVDEDGNINTATGTEVGGTDNNTDGYFNGIYATVKTIPVNTLDLYLLQLKDSNASSGESLGQDILTYGLRLNGGVMNIDWTAEAAWQSGDAAEDIDQSANFYAIKAGYTLPEVANLRIGAEYVYGSGDDDATDDEVNTFNQLYPTNHPLYGVSDVVVTNTLGNLTAWSVNVGAKPAKGLKLVAEYWNYTASKENAAGEDAIGTEFNIQAWYAINANVDLHAYWARFSPDDYVTGGGAASDDETDNVTLQVAVKF